MIDPINQEKLKQLLHYDQETGIFTWLKRPIDGKRGQNSFNRKKYSNNTSSFKGVRQVNNKWLARIGIGEGHRKHLGYFETPEEAHAAYCEAALIYHGEFSCFE